MATFQGTEFKHNFTVHFFPLNYSTYTYSNIYPVMRFWILFLSKHYMDGSFVNRQNGF